MGKVENELKHYHQLANLSLRTITTVLAVLFAYVLASNKIPINLKVNINVVWLLILVGVFASGVSLVSGEKEVRLAKWFAYLAFLLMFLTIGVMIALLSGIMYSLPVG